MNEYQYPG